MSVAFCSTHFLLAQSPQQLKVRQYKQANEHSIISEFVSFLKLPNIVGDSAGIYKNAVYYGRYEETGNCQCTVTGTCNK